MKRSRVSLEDIADWETLNIAFGRAALGKRGRGDVEAFRADLDRNLGHLRQSLLDENYAPGPMRSFSIRDPKPRMIHAPAFRDRVVHHALMAHMGPVLDRSLIADSYACRVGKGSHAAVARAARLSRRADWFIHADIGQYFASVDHGVLIGQLERKFSDHGLMRLVGRILAAHHPNSGLPIGALTSQNFANFHLGEVDRLISEHSCSLGYVRYMDDMVWWADNAEACRDVLHDLRAKLAEMRLALKLGPEPRRSRDGMTFCGFRVFPGRVLLAKRARRRFMGQLSAAECAFQAGQIDEAELQQRVDPVLATIAHADAREWRRSLLEDRQLEEFSADG